MTTRVLTGLARVVARRGIARTVLAGAVAAAICLAVLGLPVVGQLVPARDDFDDPGSEAAHVESALADAGLDVPGGVGALVTPSSGARSVVATLRRDRGVAETHAVVARDRRSTYVSATLRHAPPAQLRTTVQRLRRDFAGRRDVLLGGPQVAFDEAGKQTEHDLRRAELIAFPLLLLAALLVFRGGVAALLPLVTGALSVLITLAAMRLENEAVQLSSFALNLVTALSLGLAIDYSLFVVSRYREELRGGAPPPQALERTLATAGRTIAISAITVSFALGALFVFPERFLRSMAICGATVALSALVAAAVVLPAALALLRRRIDALSLRRWRDAVRREHADSGPWRSLATWVVRHRVPVAVATAALLVALAVPATGARFVPFGAEMLPRDASARAVEQKLRREFPVRGSPATVVAHAGRDGRGRVAAFARRLRALDGVVAVDRPRQLGPGRWYLGVQSRYPDNSAGAEGLVRRIRDRPAGFAFDVGGETAAAMDKTASLGRQLPAALAILAAATFALVFLLTRSVVLPVKTLLINLLTIAATFGVLVLVFQHGFLQGVFGIEHQNGLEATQPVLLCALAFALTTDYGIFLLARITEAHRRGADSAEAAAAGLQRTGRVVTAAALLFCIAVGVLVGSSLDFVKLLAIGTCTAVIVDATVVRALLVPSLVGLLGRWNWWAPGRGTTSSTHPRQKEATMTRQYAGRWSGSR